MMYYINLLISILILIGCFYIVYLVCKRNRNIVVKGHDEFLTICLVMFFVIIIFPITPEITMMEIVRNIIIYTFLFATFSIRRGICIKGFAKVFFIIPWKDITNIEVSIYQNFKFKVVCYTKNFHCKLIFKEIQLKRVMWELAKYNENIVIEKSLQDKLMKQKP